MFQKAMDLDLRWHLMRKTGEVTRIMDRGTSSIQQVLSTGRVLAQEECMSPTFTETCNLRYITLRQWNFIEGQKSPRSGQCKLGMRAQRALWLTIPMVSWCCSS